MTDADMIDSTRSVPPDSALLSCVAVFGRALQREFEPRRFADDLSAELRALVPHDTVSIAYLSDDRHTFSIFADQEANGLWPSALRYTTDVNRPDRFRVHESPLAPVFDDQILHASDLPADARFSGQADALCAAGLRSAVAVPVCTDGRAIGALIVAARTAAIDHTVQLDRLRGVGHLIGPFVETIALLYRERRRRHRVGLLTGINRMMATTLHLREILASVGEAVRPAIPFDAMGVIMLHVPGATEWSFFGTAGEPPAPGIDHIPASQFSYGEALKAGRRVLFHEASKEVDLAWAGDRVLLTAQLESCLWVPFHFGDDVGGSLFFGKHEAYWYDDVDVEVAADVASQIVLGIQHQRLAEEQRRVASAERRARSLEQRLDTVRGELHRRYGFDQILGGSPLLREALTNAALVAPTETTVLITGESGTGKEMVARAVHYTSARADGPFVAVNCAALPDTLLESELFGHERGAFTGADRQKPGRFDMAAGGSLFLDEIGEMSAAVQVKLLRVLQEREYQRVGGTATLRADVRLIAATNRDLMAEIAAGRFREDLFYRLSVFNVHLPPLRERGDDVLLLADDFVRALAARMGKSDVALSQDARDLLRRHPWRGNIRELQNAIERALITCDGSLITAVHLGLGRAPDEGTPPQAPAPSAPPSGAGALHHLEREAIIDALRRTHGHKSRAAALLGLSRFQLNTRLKRHNIDVPRA